MPEISFLEGPNEPDPVNTGVGTGRAHDQIVGDGWLVFNRLLLTSPRLSPVLFMIFIERITFETDD